MNVYYILRDRIPVYLSLIWMYRWRISQRDFLGIPLTDLIGYYLMAITGLCLVGSMILLMAGETFMIIFNFRWSFPSPLTWGLLTLAGTVNLMRKGGGGLFSVFESYYLSFMSATSGGWVYEVLRGIPYWIRSDFAYWNWYKFNLQKVFLFEYQVFCFPIVMYILIKIFGYKPSKELCFLGIAVITWYLLGIQLDDFYHQLGNFAGNTYYSWVMRLPMALFLYSMLDEVKK